MDNEEFYVRALLCVSDVTRSIQYYREKLDFSVNWQHPEHDPIIAEVGRHGFNVILDAQSAIPRAAVPTVLSLTLHEEHRLGTLHREFAERGANIRTPPFEVVWEKELFQFEVEDPDGNILVLWGARPE